jgi:hypothetical protein
VEIPLLVILTVLAELNIDFIICADQGKFI